MWSVYKKQPFFSSKSSFINITLHHLTLALVIILSSTSTTPSSLQYILTFITMRTAFISVLALATSFLSVSAAPTADRALLDKRASDPTDIVDGLYSTVQGYTGQISKSIPVLTSSPFTVHFKGLTRFFSRQHGSIIQRRHHRCHHCIIRYLRLPDEHPICRRQRRLSSHSSCAQLQSEASSQRRWPCQHSRQPYSRPQRSVELSREHFGSQ